MGLADLPTELILHIYSFLERRGKVGLQQTAHRFFTILSSSEWRYLEIGLFVNNKGDFKSYLKSLNLDANVGVYKGQEVAYLARHIHVCFPKDRNPRLNFLDHFDGFRLQLQQVVCITFGPFFFTQWMAETDLRKPIVHMEQTTRLLRAMPRLKHIVLVFGNCAGFDAKEGDKFYRRHPDVSHDIWLQPFLNVYGERPKSGVTFELHTVSFHAACKLAGRVDLVALTGVTLFPYRLHFRLSNSEPRISIRHPRRVGHTNLTLPPQGMLETRLPMTLLKPVAATLKRLEIRSTVGIVELAVVLTPLLRDLTLTQSIVTPEGATFEHLHQLRLGSCCIGSLNEFVSSLYMTGNNLRLVHLWHNSASPFPSEENSASPFPSEFSYTTHLLPKLLEWMSITVRYAAYPAAPLLPVIPQYLEDLIQPTLDHRLISQLKGHQHLAIVHLCNPDVESTDPALLDLVRNHLPMLQRLNFTLAPPVFRLSRAFLDAFFDPTNRKRPRMLRIKRDSQPVEPPTQGQQFPPGIEMVWGPREEWTRDIVAKWVYTGKCQWHMGDYMDMLRYWHLQNGWSKKTSEGLATAREASTPEELAMVEEHAKAELRAAEEAQELVELAAAEEPATE
ncbi:hypothetical protein EDC01DRAFT_673655 [Geopyxis carbonaria]|nr:hypothetical protein EDC01DRAFT_673655 [Geopyxis carbonaria]